MLTSNTIASSAPRLMAPHFYLPIPQPPSAFQCISHERSLSGLMALTSMHSHPVFYVPGTMGVINQLDTENDDQIVRAGKFNIKSSGEQNIEIV